MSDIKPFEQFNAHDAFGFGEEDFITIYVADEEIIKDNSEEIIKDNSEEIINNTKREELKIFLSNKDKNNNN